MEADQQELDAQILEQVKALKEKYDVMGQDVLSYLGGLMHSKYLNYWEYIELDTLLTLQKPRTELPDENIFIIYHQITELYFKLILMEMEQCSQWEEVKGKDLMTRVARCNRYMEHLVDSFDIMVDGMDRKQFLQFRLALLPASGFQSVQYRKIEIRATDFKNLLHLDQREQFETAEKPDVEQMYEHLYWRFGAIEEDTGKRTLTLKQFEEKYGHEMMRLGKKVFSSNLWQQFNKVSDDDPDKTETVKVMRRFDHLVNVEWPLAHYRSAVRYLKRDAAEDLAATGGTNWRKYLPPKHQLQLFYPELWTEEEKNNWGKKTLLKMLYPDD